MDIYCLKVYYPCELFLLVVQYENIVFSSEQNCQLNFRVKVQSACFNVSYVVREGATFIILGEADHIGVRQQHKNTLHSKTIVLQQALPLSKLGESNFFVVTDVDSSAW